MHLVRAPEATVLLDCGLFQGRRRESFERNRTLRVPVRELDAVVLSHAHIDHSGDLPLLYKSGYRGPIFTTPATRDLCAAMLEDAAMIQEQDAAYVNHLVERGVPGVEPVEPRYDREDVASGWMKSSARSSNAPSPAGARSSSLPSRSSERKRSCSRSTA